MTIVAYPQTITDLTTSGHRVGGFYEQLEDIEQAAENLDFDVVVPPRCKQGYYMVPAGPTEE
jgi:hypothetical protein